MTWRSRTWKKPLQHGGKEEAEEKSGTYAEEKSGTYLAVAVAVSENASLLVG
jgi:hypothetical protein